MLDTETKNNIDSARQILVGKVPDPKSQIEQITIALIYKFMDDMDKENQDAGFKKQYFVKDWQKYAWTKLLDQRLSGQELIDLYVQAISNIPKNPYIPQLFRDIFRDAFLPYKDSRTLSLFIKEINKFTYDNSENLGNAFEYLLSILGSQGDAGQFRTPRHIIDFIVAVVDPQKNEKILDPACGTAGFLISAYKHIIKPKYLTTSENLKLMNNVVGYDISPDMVRLALVNLYLHGFSNPKIYEYDTLTSEKRWEENFDVILANPPFMSPKGGIIPHDKFSVSANRSEVLFVDYIAEHLTLKGRAGIIVPEGIIFQSGNAYKELRKLLVDEFYLYAVVSLPGGVFQPYSGVKTSILFLDRQMAKQKKNILFVKIDNDGFDLGAQRRPSNANDLPEALKIINDWKAGKNVAKNNRVIVANRKQIAENGDYNLSAERYRIIEKKGKQKWEMVKLGKYIDFVSGLTLSIPECESKTGIPIISINNILEDGKLTKKGLRFVNIPSKCTINYLQKGDLLFNWRNGSKHLVGKTGFFDWDGKYVFASFCLGIRTKTKYLDNRYLWYVLNYCRLNGTFMKLMRQNVNGLFNREELKILQIPLPPLAVQERIVAEIETYQKIIDGARQVIETWKPTIKVDEKWDVVKLGDVIDTIVPPKKIQMSEFLTKGKYPIIDQSQKNISGYSNDDDAVINITTPVVIFGDHTCVIKYADMPFIQGADGIKVLKTHDRLLPKFLYYYLKSNPIKSEGYNRHFTKLKQVQIPLPPLDVQEQIVAEIEAEQKAVDACKELIKIHENKINETINKVWSES
ncbi:MAG: N-6 DNA methylase [Planctomycetaceae bacterium]|jgi:type I restriction enzyme M protein|nr:N-6 DNA methylase [Planctomycetaceae bacterium]